jgi:Putative Zn-dependent protease, contains TPR repeats
MIKIISILFPILLGIIGYKMSSKKMSKYLEKNSSILKDPIINSLLKKLSFSLNLPQLEVYILEDLNINGLASNDGKVFLTKGFLEKYYSGTISAEELIGVISHELGHLALGHTKKRMLTYSLQNALQMGLGYLISRFIPFIGIYISSFFTSLLTAKLSRIDEYEADKYASALMIKVGIGIEPLITLFEKLDKLTVVNDNLSWLKSHPSSKERIKEIKKNATDWSLAK